MDFSEEHREKLCGDIIVTAAEALKEGKISRAEMMYIASSLLKAMEKYKTHEEFVGFLGELAESWEIFEHLYTLEKGEGKEVEEQQAISQMQSLIKTQNVDKALEKGEEILHATTP
jgi:hypothetical protein